MSKRVTIPITRAKSFILTIWGSADKTYKHISTLPFVLTLTLVTLRCVIYLLPPEDFTWLDNILNSLRKFHPDTIKDIAYSRITEAAAFPGFALWFLLSVLYIGSCIAAFCIGAYVIHTSLNIKSKLTTVKLSLLFVAVVLFIFHYIQVYYRIHDVCGQQDVWSLIVCKTITNEKHIVSYHLWSDALGIGITVFISGAVSLLLLSNKLPRQTRTPKEEAKHLRDQFRLLRLILYVGAILLIFATLRLSVILHWALAYLQPAPSFAEDKEVMFIYKNVDTLISTMITSMGAFYTMFLAIVYIPAALVLNDRAAKLNKKGLSLPLSDHLLRLAAILGPLLAGPIGEILARLKG